MSWEGDVFNELTDKLKAQEAELARAKERAHVAAIENARLRSQYDGVKEDLRICRENKKARVDELARLREYVKYAEQFEGVIARLREERDNAVATLTDYSKSVEGMHRTIARLREKLESELKHCRQAQDEAARLREERDALKLLLDNRTYELVAPLIAAKEEVWLSQQADYEGRITKVEEENAVLRRGLHRHAGLDYEDVLANEKEETT